MQTDGNDEKLRELISECRSALCEYLEKIIQNGSPIVNEAYTSYIIEKTKIQPSEVIGESIDSLLFILDSLKMHGMLESLQQLNEAAQQAEDIMDGASEADCRGQVFANLSQYGISTKWLVSHGLASKQEMLVHQQSANATEFVYKKVKGGIRIDATTATGGVVIPEFIDGLPVIKVGRNAFAKRKDITSVILPQYLTEIEPGAFADSGIISIAIPNNVEDIGESAFQNCKLLQHIQLPQNLKVIKTYTFGGCTGLTSIQIPHGTTAISERAFDRCKNLKKIQIPSSVTRIGFAAIPQKTVVYCDLQSRASRFVVDSNMPFYQPFEMYEDS